MIMMIFVCCDDVDSDDDDDDDGDYGDDSANIFMLWREPGIPSARRRCPAISSQVHSDSSHVR